MDEDSGNGSVLCCGDFNFHLHGLDDENLLTVLYGIADIGADFDYIAFHRRFDLYFGSACLRGSCRCSRWSGLRRLSSFCRSRCSSRSCRSVFELDVIAVAIDGNGGVFALYGIDYYIVVFPVDLELVLFHYIVSFII